MISLSNGHQFEYIAASGALAYDGRGWPWEWPLRWIGKIDPTLFTIVTKTLTAKPRQGNLRWLHPWTCVKTFSEGVVNAIGLTNPGLDWWLDQVQPKLNPRYSMVVSITEDDPLVLRQMIQQLQPSPIKAVEFNASCPNTHQDVHHNSDLVISLTEQICKESKHPVFLKLSITQDYLTIAKALQGKVQALSINSVPWSYLFPDQTSPLSKLGGGGVSGKMAQKHTWKMVAELAKQVSIPVIAPGIWEFEDINKVRNLGAKAISFGSIFVKFPWRPTQFVLKENT